MPGIGNAIIAGFFCNTYTYIHTNHANKVVPPYRVISIMLTQDGYMGPQYGTILKI